MLRELELTGATIALESSNPSQILASLNHRLPEFVADVKSFVYNLFDTVPQQASLIDTHTTEKAIAKSNYVALSELLIFVPQGMNKEYLTYIHALNSSQHVVDDLLPNVLNPSISWLGKLLAQPESMGSMRSQLTGIVTHPLDKVNKEIADCFSKHDSLSKVAYGTAFKRNSDFIESIKEINHIQEKLLKTPRQDVMNAVNQITELLDKLLIRMQQQPEVYKPSGVTMQDISKVALALGHEIEFYAAHTFMVRACSESLRETKEKIEQLYK